MRQLLVVTLLFSLSTPVFAQEEDAAHRADRLRTQQLNRRAAAMVSRRDAGNGTGQADYRAAQERYQRQMADWRRRVDACNRGDWSACDR